MLPLLTKNSKGRAHMGRIVVTEYMSVDGVVEAPSGDESFERVGWTDAFSRGPEGEKFKLDETMNSDALLLGRVTYDGFAPVWPHYAGELADKFNTMPKYVVSQTLTNPEWNNTTVLSGDVVGEVRKLKERYDGDIVVHGSPQCQERGTLSPNHRFEMSPVHRTPCPLTTVP